MPTPACRVTEALNPENHEMGPMDRFPENNLQISQIQTGHS